MLTLGELCELVAGHTTLVIELKGNFAGDTRLAARTAAVLAGYNGPVAVMSFDPGLMAALRNLAPALALGLVGMRRDADAPVPAQMSALRYLRQALAKKHGVSPDAIVLGNGSNELIELLARTFVRSGDEVVIPHPSFVVYPSIVQAVGGTRVVVALINM